MTKTYVKNLETSKIELHFTKEEFQALTAEQKKDLKSSYLWSRVAGAWVSRSKNNHYSAIKTAEKLGFVKGETIGERLSYEEELNRKAEKAENRIERFEQYAQNAAKKGESLQAEFNSYHGDISYFTQPIIRGHAGSEAFAKRRQRVFDRYEKGFQEYRKSEYFKEKAITAQNTAEKKQLKNKVYLDNRIKESNARINKLQKNIVSYEDQIFRINNGEIIKRWNGEPIPVEKFEEWLTETLDKIEWEMDKLAFLENCFDELDGNNYNKETIKAGYHVKVRGNWNKVLKANKTTVDTEVIEGGAKGMILRRSYAEIQEMRVPEDWSEPKKAIAENPFKEGDILTATNIGGNRITTAYQVVKTTDKTVTIQKVKIEDNKPLQNEFISDKTERKTVKKDRQGNFVVNNGDWYLYPYVTLTA